MRGILFIGKIADNVSVRVFKICTLLRYYAQCTITLIIVNVKRMPAVHIAATPCMHIVLGGVV